MLGFFNHFKVSPLLISSLSSFPLSISLLFSADLQLVPPSQCHQLVFITDLSPSLTSPLVNSDLQLSLSLSLKFDFSSFHCSISWPFDYGCAISYLFIFVCVLLICDLLIFRLQTCSSYFIVLCLISIFQLKLKPTIVHSNPLTQPMVIYDWHRVYNFFTRLNQVSCELVIPGYNLI